jgi:hypothetical protein
MTARLRAGPASRASRKKAFTAPSRCLPMPRCGRKKGSLMVESSGCAAFGHPAAAQGSLSDYHREETWVAEASRASRIRRGGGERSKPMFLVEHDRCRSRLVPRGYLLQRFGGSSCELLATTAISRENRRPRLRAAALSRAEGHATTARREPNSSQLHRAAKRRHEPRLRVPCKLGWARWDSFACCRGPSIQPQSGRFLVAPFRIAREATTSGRVPACRREIRQCPTKC